MPHSVGPEMRFFKKPRSLHGYRLSRASRQIRADQHGTCDTLNYCSVRHKGKWGRSVFWRVAGKWGYKPHARRGVPRQANPGATAGHRPAKCRCVPIWAVYRAGGSGPGSEAGAAGAGTMKGGRPVKGGSVCDCSGPIISCVRRAPVRGRGAGTGCRRSSTVEHSFRFESHRRLFPLISMARSTRWFRALDPLACSVFNGAVLPRDWIATATTTMGRAEARCLQR